jgi:hypothetical protein
MNAGVIVQINSIKVGGKINKVICVTSGLSVVEIVFTIEDKPLLIKYILIYVNRIKTIEHLPKLSNLVQIQIQ